MRDWGLAGGHSQTPSRENVQRDHDRPPLPSDQLREASQRRGLPRLSPATRLGGYLGGALFPAQLGSRLRPCY